MSEDDKPARKSKPPKDYVRVNIPVRWLIVAAVALLGGGGLTGDFFDFMERDTDEKDHKHEDEEKAAPSMADDERFVKIDMTLDEHTAQIAELDESVDEIDAKTENIQKVQHQAIASQEARRVTEKIEPRSERERKYDRILLKNLDRLKKGDAPCEDARCSD